MSYSELKEFLFKRNASRATLLNAFLSTAFLNNLLLNKIAILLFCDEECLASKTNMDNQPNSTFRPFLRIALIKEELFNRLPFVNVAGSMEIRLGAKFSSFLGSPPCEDFPAPAR